MALTIVATTQPGNTPPRVFLDVDTTGYTGLTLSIFRVLGDTQTLVRDSETSPDIADIQWLGYDYECPFGTPVTYQVVVYDGATAVASAVSSAVSLDPSGVWLIHPGAPTRSIEIEVKDLGSRKRSVTQSTQRVLGRSDPVVTTDARSTVESVLAIYTDALDDLTAVHDILADGQTLLLNIPPANAWGVTAEWIACGDSEEQRIVEIGSRPHRVTSIPYAVVARPEGDLAPLRTYADLLGESASYSAVLAARATYAAVLTGS